MTASELMYINEVHMQLKSERESGVPPGNSKVNLCRSDFDRRIHQY